MNIHAKIEGPDLKALKWFQESRKISPETLAQLPVASATVFFPDANAKLPAVQFLYTKGWKARSFPDKHFVSGGGFEREFWNLPAVLAANRQVIWIVEGELDACALVEAGVRADSVLAAQGAKDKPTEGDPIESPGYAYVTAALKAGLNRAEKIIWCGDSDGPGLLLREDMVRIFGPAKFHFVEWPEGTKDANDLLRTDGPAELKERVMRGDLPWPVVGIFQLPDLPEPPPLPTWEPGFPQWESKVRLAPKTLSVVTGHPGHGKTALWNQIWFHVVKTYCVPICTFSAETRPKPHVRRQLRALYSGGLERNMSDKQREAADAWIKDRYFWLVHADNCPSLEWILDRAAVCVIRYGCRILGIDPWNRVEGSRKPNEREDEYVLRCLRTMYAFAVDFNVHVQVLAHPAKMEGHRRGSAPQLEDIAGAKHWDNMPDQGFTVHRPKMWEKGQMITEAQFYHRKARIEELGYPCKLGLNFDRETGRFKSVDYDVL